MTTHNFINLGTGEVEPLEPGHTLHKFAQTQNNHSERGRLINIHAIDIDDLITPVIAFDGVVNTQAYCTLTEMLMCTSEWLFANAKNTHQLADIKQEIDDWLYYIWTDAWGDDTCAQCGKKIEVPTDKENE